MPAPLTARRTWRAYWLGATLAVLLQLPTAGILFGAGQPDGFFAAPGPADFLAALGVHVVFAAALSLGAWWTPEGETGRRVRRVAFLFVVAAAALSVKRAVLFALPPVVRDLPPVAWSGGIMGALVAGLVADVRTSGATSRAMARGLGYFALLPLLVIGSTAWTGLTRAVATPLAYGWTTDDGRAAPRRAVVMVFDELDQRELFDIKDSNLRAFRALRDRSLAFDYAIPAAWSTFPSLVGLLRGRAVDRVTPTAPLGAVAERGRDTVGPWENQWALPASAAMAGVPAAVVGWHLPYCRPIPREWRDCASFPMQPVGIPLGFHDGIAARMAGQVLSLLPRAGTMMHVAQDMLLSPVMLQAAGDSTLGLVLLHVPLPHPPVVAAPDGTRRLSWAGTSYRNNLARADRLLDSLVAAATRGALDARTLLIVTGDHGWRLAEATRGSRDGRVPLLVRVPGAAPRRQPKCRYVVRATHVVGAWLAGEPLLPATVDDFLAEPDSSRRRTTAPSCDTVLPVPRSGT